MEPFAYIPEDTRLTTFPLGRPNLFKWYEQARDAFWVPNEISFTTDADQYATVLTADEKHFVKFILAFFAASDGLVNVNIAQRIKEEIKILEVGYFFNFQMAMEDIHAQTYSLLLEAIIPSPAERAHLFNAFKTIPIIETMTKYIQDVATSSAPLAERLLRMACVEGIFFQGNFCGVYWFQQRGLLPALGHSNELISRDEALHTTYDLVLYDMLESWAKLTGDRVHEIVGEAVEIGRLYTKAALPNGMPGMNAGLMSIFIENRADDIVDMIGYVKVFNSPKSIFTFNDQISLMNRTNFFERRVSEYKQSTTDDTDTGTFHEDF